MQNFMHITLQNKSNKTCEYYPDYLAFLPQNIKLMISGETIQCQSKTKPSILGAK